MTDSAGQVMLLRARAHFRSTRDGTDYRGHARCEGAPCPFRRAVLNTVLSGPKVLSLVSFRSEQGSRVAFCVSCPSERLTDLDFSGSYTCQSWIGHTRIDVSPGAMVLTRY